MLIQAAKLAVREVASVSEDEQNKGTEDIFMRKAKAVVFVIASLMVIFTPWIMLGVQFYCLITLQKEFPMFEQTMYFCGACIMGLLGISPYVLDLIGKNRNGR